MPRLRPPRLHPPPPPCLPHPHPHPPRPRCLPRPPRRVRGLAHPSNHPTRSRHPHPKPRSRPQANTRTAGRAPVDPLPCPARDHPTLDGAMGPHPRRRARCPLTPPSIAPPAFRRRRDPRGSLPTALGSGMQTRPASGRRKPRRHPGPARLGRRPQPSPLPAGVRLAPSRLRVASSQCPDS